MTRELSFTQKVERSISKTYRERIWTPFITAIKNYKLIEEGDKIAVCISGGKDSMLLAKLIQMLHRHSDFKFDVVYLVMDPGYNERNRKKIEDNARLLEIPITVFETDIFDVANKIERSPCYVCAKMRRGHLYHRAKDLGCNKIALGHHMSDVIETTVMAMFYGSQLQGMMPKLHSLNFEGMELIRPLYCINEQDIINWKNYNSLEFIQCACRFTEKTEMLAPEGEKKSGDSDALNGDSLNGDINESKRLEIKNLIKKLKRINPNIENSIFNSIHSVCIETFPGYKTEGQLHSFLEDYKNRKPQKG
ncbi:MAG: tRNA 2-thiocytidine biosynthesis protein TtcA [Fibrobacter sp.]|nr:tRNA 2-thiocytidine biosynthesis protein TtcA [Fibrobacter sp.]